ncbi:glycosyltransferase [Nostoc parmelioides]|uniref:Glycosyltransferase n=1 Tax=Nostoc parmelioides FACHB-3921 TaxID=2692909 RepID=A0ABR8BGU6_9NOSO|nr:glycosyltransferase [Nostoc parmelioides]MBD2253160.1 glycosyltransferase [Nostoc parmelioides FACHB-3921]
MKNKYIFYSRIISQKPDTAHEIHDVLCANGAANLGYASVLVYPEPNRGSGNTLDLLNPFQPKQPDQNFVDFYDVQDKLKVASLPMPWPIDCVGGKFTASSTVVTRYYLPFHLLKYTKIVHTRDWNFVQAAIKNRIPTIYERHYFQKEKVPKAIVESPFLQVAVTQSEIIRQSLIEQGFPPEKVVWVHNGFDQSFLLRQSEQATAWRKELLKDEHQSLVVYSGALYPFKGIDVLIDAAKELPQVQFAITGGKTEQVTAYQQLAKDKQVENVKFLGWILPRQRLVSLFQAADILVHPHCSGKSANFTNPVKFFQYMASGTPIVITEIPPLMLFKDMPLAAVWCEPDNPYQLAKALKQALEIYPRQIEGYTNNIALAKPFSWENRAEKILSYVDESFRPPLIA